MFAVEVDHLSYGYRGKRALRECTVNIPAGRVVGLVGPNGAGKTTLFRTIVGLLTPTSGQVSVLGGSPRDPRVLARIGFVSQDKPLYPGFTVDEMLRFGRRLNPGWDDQWARERVRRLGIPLDRRTARLSGGQQAQVALAMALGKRPRLLILDEPAADLDPLARRDFLRVLMEEVADSDLTVLLSSHQPAELERVCDHLVVLSDARVRLEGPTEQLLADHRQLVGPRGRAKAITSAFTVVQAGYTDRQAALLVRLDGRRIHDPAWAVRPVGLEELILGYLADPGPDHRPALTLADAPSEV